MNRQARIDGKVADLFAEFEARLRALGFTTTHQPASDGQDGFLSYQEARSGDLSCATCEETGEITEWFDKEHVPGRNGEYQVRRGNEVSFEIFKDGAWEGGEPDAWRGIDWRISKQEHNRHLTVLRDQVQGSKPDAALALIRHHICANSNDRVMNTLTDEFGIRAKVCCGVILRKDLDGANQIFHLVNDDVLEPVPEDVRQQIEHRIETFDLRLD
jgi:hypothetical protein